MKHAVWMIIASISVIAVLIGVVSYHSPSASYGGEIQLNSLTALTNGQVSFNVTLNEAESATVENVLLNNTQYLWSDGSSENSTIFKGETKQWSINIGSLQNGSNIQVTVKTPTKATSDNVTVITQPTEPANDSGNVTEPTEDSDYVYDQYGGVGLFTEGIHVIATEQDPTTLTGGYEIVNDYWTMLAEHETTTATEQEFIAIILSRGDKTTGGYTINVESFGWLESYPVKFRFQVNITDPGQGVMVTEALTNPLVMIPIGKLTAGEYHIEVNIEWYIQTIDEEGNMSYIAVPTYVAMGWNQTLVITHAEEPEATFSVTVNENQAPDLTVHVNLNNITDNDAEKIVEASFIQTMGDQTLHQLDTLTRNETSITAHYIWGVDENDMGHVFDVTVDLNNKNITITHCR